MSLHDRAAQFAPFAALTGYGELIGETARLTERRPELSDEETARLNARLNLLEQTARLLPEAQITFFVPDGNKDGGACVRYSGRVRVVDVINGELIFKDKTRIPIADILDIEFL